MLGLHNIFNTLTGRGKKKEGCDTPLYKAVKDGSLGEVRRLLRNGADPNARNAHNLTPLHQAAYWGEKDIVELLLKYGAKADADNGKGWTPLHSAAVSGGMKKRKEIIELLLARGASPDKADKHGWTAKDYMVLWQENTEAAEKLKKYLAMLEGDGRSVRPSKKPPTVHTPKH